MNISAYLFVFVSVALLTYAVLQARMNRYQLALQHYRRRRTGLLLAVTPFLQYVVRLNRRWLTDDNEYFRNLQDKARNAGIAVPFTAQELVALQEILAVGMSLLGVALIVVFHAMLKGKLLGGMVFIIILAGLGAILPVLPIDSAINARRLQILREWPYFLDLLTLSMESGMDMAQAISRIISYSPLSPLVEELMQLLNEIRLGARRADALNAMASRINVPTITQVINMIVQAERLGTELAPLLRIQAREFREHRAQLVEKAAMESPVKMMLPLLGCIFPAVMIILIGPSMIQYFQMQ